jgi:hypothetical protein|tara:strand:- start:60 stop:296 length:237 start_codon:yes stop_codon:yes gene_type:complete
MERTNFCSVVQNKTGGRIMVTNRTALEKYEEKDPLWWCLYHKNTLSYLKLRVKQWQDAETEEERDKIMSLINVVLRAD